MPDIGVPLASGDIANFEEWNGEMTTELQKKKRRRWADVVVIVASMYALLSAGWAPLELLDSGEGYEVSNSAGLWWVYALGGALGIAALATARRWTGLAKGLAAAGGIAILAGFLMLDRVTVFAALSLGGTGLALLGAAPFVGPMPTPEEEGKSRVPGEN